MPDKLKRIKRQLVHTGHIVDFYDDYIELPDGRVVVWDFISHKGAAAVVPVTKDGKILMVRQYRNALDRETIELPAGALETREEPTLACAQRELEEETGYRANHFEFLISLKTTVAFCDEKIDIYVARDLVKTTQNLDEDEYIDVEAFDIKELMDLIYAGKIQDSKTISGIMSYYAKYCKGE